MKKQQLPDKANGPFMPWMFGDFAETQTIVHHFPTPFLLLCKLCGVTPAQVVRDIADNLSCSAWRRQGRGAAKEYLFNYFIAHGYGANYFNEEELRTIFGDMDAVGRLFPFQDPALAELYGQWRDLQYASWFNRWYTKNDRKMTLREIMR
jgi:hypothetical protein